MYNYLKKVDFDKRRNCSFNISFINWDTTDNFHEYQSPIHVYGLIKQLKLY